MEEQQQTSSSTDDRPCAPRNVASVPTREKPVCRGVPSAIRDTSTSAVLSVTVRDARADTVIRRAREIRGRRHGIRRVRAEAGDCARGQLDPAVDAGGAGVVGRDGVVPN